MATDGCSAGSGKIVHSPKFWPNLGSKTLTLDKAVRFLASKTLTLDKEN
jgi:hypothetical protein